LAYLYTLKQFGFSTAEKLKSSKQIGKLFQEGRRFHHAPIRVSWILEPWTEGEHLQAGVGASGKHFKRAVDRNRVKRLLREAWRLQKGPLKAALTERRKKLNVFFIYSSKELPVYQELYQRMGEVIHKLMTTIHEDPAANT
jgi:ribonuclease P protein component